MTYDASYFVTLLVLAVSIIAVGFVYEVDWLLRRAERLIQRALSRLHHRWGRK